MVLDALDSVGLRGDGRLLALNSYENRVYQVGREEGQPVVVKFYRPERWSDAAILEEHAFVPELADARCRWCRRWCSTARTLHEFGGFRFAVFPAAAAARPSCPTRRCWNGSGASSAASTRSARASPTPSGPALNLDTFGREPRAWLLARLHPA
jgi:hypothetical protein